MRHAGFVDIGDNLSHPPPLSVPALERGREIGFAHCRRPDEADDDDAIAMRVNDFPSPENQFAPTAVTQLVEAAAGVRVLNEDWARS